MALDRLRQVVGGLSRKAVLKRGVGLMVNIFVLIFLCIISPSFWLNRTERSSISVGVGSKPLTTSLHCSSSLKVVQYLKKRTIDIPGKPQTQRQGGFANGFIGLFLWQIRKMKPLATEFYRQSMTGWLLCDHHGIGTLRAAEG